MLLTRSNRFSDVDSAVVRRDSSTVAVVDTVVQARDWLVPRELPGGLPRLDDRLTQMGRAAIIVDEWGPYDWRTPKLWPVDSSRATPLALRVLGPTGQWRVIGQRGVAHLPRRAGNANDTIVVTPTAGDEHDWRITLRAQDGRAFSYERFQPINSWRVTFTTFGDSVRLDGREIRSLETARLDYMWYRPLVPELPQSRWAAVATARVELPPGSTYTLRSISDDGIRVFVDGQRVIDNWQAHGSEVDHAAIAPGRHELRVEYYQLDGWVELRVEIVRGRETSSGSPGPH